MTRNISLDSPRRDALPAPYRYRPRTLHASRPAHSRLVAPVESTLGSLDDDGGVREREVLEVDGVLRGAGVRPVYEIAFNETHGSGHVSTGDTFYGRVEVIEGLALDNLSADLAANTERREATLDDDDAVIERQKM